MKKINFLKNNRGITLVALVVTIVVLLIMAGVAISLVLGNEGIIEQAKSSKTVSEIGQEKEALSLAYGAVLTDKVSRGDTTAVTSAELSAQLQSDGVNASAQGSNPIVVTFQPSGRQYEVSNNGQIAQKNNGQSGGQSSEENPVVAREPQPNEFLYDVKGNGKAKIIGYNYPYIWSQSQRYEIYDKTESYDSETDQTLVLVKTYTGTLNDGWKYHAGLCGDGGDENRFYAFNVIPKDFNLKYLEESYYDSDLDEEVSYEYGVDYVIYDSLDIQNLVSTDDIEGDLSGSIVNTCGYFDYGTIIPETVTLKQSTVGNYYEYDASGTTYTIDEIENIYLVDYNVIQAFSSEEINTFTGYGEPYLNAPKRDRYLSLEYNLIIPGSVKSVSNIITPRRYGNSAGASNNNDKIKITYEGTKSEFISAFGYIGKLEQNSYEFFNSIDRFANEAFEIECSDGKLYSHCEYNYYDYYDGHGSYTDENNVVYSE